MPPSRLTLSRRAPGVAPTTPDEMLDPALDPMKVAELESVGGSDFVAASDEADQIAAVRDPSPAQAAVPVNGQIAAPLRLCNPAERPAAGRGELEPDPCRPGQRRLDPEPLRRRREVLGRDLEVSRTGRRREGEDNGGEGEAAHRRES